MRSRLFFLISFVTPFLLIATSLSGADPEFSPEELDHFEKKVRPILANRCYECHSTSGGKTRGGLNLDDRQAILTGGDSGPAAVPGEIENSLLIEAVLYDPDGLQMPPSGKLPQEEIELLSDWVKRSLPHPAPREQKHAAAGIDLEAGRKHWAFQPLVDQPLPAIDDLEKFPNRIDPFIESKRRELNLRASPPADPRTLIRRVWFDLLGLPPSPEELDEWTVRLQSAPPKDDAPYRELIDTLLASPHYGERWGRYWLDLARYADIGESWREGEGRPWRYRDWVVNALNQDLPYDQFLSRQLAADLLPNADPLDNAALGFLGLSPEYWKELKLDHQVIRQVVAEEWEERIDTLGATLLGLSLGCARCHDHKFDPITNQDYYALAGVLASIRQADRPLIPSELAEPALAARAKAKALEAELKKQREIQNPTETQKEQLAKLQADLDQVKQTPNFDLPLACGVVDAALHVLPDGKSATKLDYRAGEAQDVELQIRGNPARTGPVVPRRFLSVLSPASEEIPLRNGSGRRELALALVTQAAPLTARVIVNRVWKWHFGQGIVDTPSNFGTHGSPPTHPELLEDLAARFVAEGWSLKWLHREILTSHAYRQASLKDQKMFDIDPENRYLWRFTPRRLDVESWRDAILKVTQVLDERLGGEPLDLADAANHRRTIYGLVKRREISELLRLFDFPDPVTHSAQRIPTTTPLQQLFVLNGPFLQQRTAAFTEKLLRESPQETDRYDWLYRRIYQRSVTDEERTIGVEFVAALKSDNIPENEAWRQYVHILLAGNEFLFVD